MDDLIFGKGIHLLQWFCLSILAWKNGKINLFRGRNFVVVKFRTVSYNICVAPPHTGNREGGSDIMNVGSFFESVAAGMTAYYVCKWLDVLLSLLE